MARRAVTAVLVLSVLGAVGCTSVQKGSVAGGAAGAAAGAGVGHYLTTLGGVPGGLIGLGLGAAGGAIAAESVYGNEQSEEALAAQEQVRQLAGELEAKDAQMRELSLAVEREKSQQQALVEAMDKGGAPSTAPEASAAAASGIQVTSDSRTVTFTILSEVMFASGKSDLTKEGRTALHEAARLIRQQYPDATVEVRGHTDNEPIRYSPYKSNWELSCARALSALHYLVESEGFRARKLTAVGYGDTQPVAPNNTDEGRRKNRRAELVVLKGTQVADVSAGQ
jgi:flagellar motor protein MotB